MKPDELQKYKGKEIEYEDSLLHLKHSGVVTTIGKDLIVLNGDISVSAGLIEKVLKVTEK